MTTTTTDATAAGPIGRNNRTSHCRLVVRIRL
jgi:hypothetical protein